MSLEVQTVRDQGLRGRLYGRPLSQHLVAFCHPGDPWHIDASPSLCLHPLWPSLCVCVLVSAFGVKGFEESNFNLRLRFMPNNSQEGLVVGASLERRIQFFYLLYF